MTRDIIRIGPVARQDLEDLARNYEDKFNSSEEVPMSNPNKLSLCLRRSILKMLLEEREIEKNYVAKKLQERHGFVNVTIFDRAWIKIRIYAIDGAYKHAQKTATAPV